MRALFDTNVLYAVMTAKGFCEEALDETAGECNIIWSERLRSEFEAILARHCKVGPGHERP